MLIQLIGRAKAIGFQWVIYYLIIYIFALTLSFSVHEFMHAFVAVKLGDETPRNMGRLTLNPLAHMDPVGTVLLLLAGFGWGKPVMYNPNNLYKLKSRRGMNIMVHLAGVTGNFFVGLISWILMLIFNGLGHRFAGAVQALEALELTFGFTYLFSLMLLAFNLLPIPPLDGFHVLEECLPYKFRNSNGYRKFSQLAPMILMIVFLISSFTRNNLLSNIIIIIERPFDALIQIVGVPVQELLNKIGLPVYGFNLYKLLEVL